MANEKDVGEDIKISVLFTRQDTQAPIDPLIVTLYVKDPANVLHTYVYNTDPNVVKTGTGAYYLYFVPTLGGIHTFQWSGAGNMNAIEEGSFRVRSSQVR